MKVLRIKYLQIGGLIQKTIEFNNIYIYIYIYIYIDELLDIRHYQFLSRVERWVYDGSGWTINSILQRQLLISEIAPSKGRSYFLLPKELRNAKLRNNIIFGKSIENPMNEVDVKM